MQTIEGKKPINRTNSIAGSRSYTFLNSYIYRKNQRYNALYERNKDVLRMENDAIQSKSANLLFDAYKQQVETLDSLVIRIRNYSMLIKPDVMRNIQLLFPTKKETEKFDYAIATYSRFPKMRIIHYDVKPLTYPNMATFMNLYKREIDKYVQVDMESQTTSVPKIYDYTANFLIKESQKQKKSTMELLEMEDIRIIRAHNLPNISVFFKRLNRIQSSINVSFKAFQFYLRQYKKLNEFVQLMKPRQLLNGNVIIGDAKKAISFNDYFILYKHFTSMIKYMIDIVAYNEAQFFNKIYALQANIESYKSVMDKVNDGIDDDEVDISILKNENASFSMEMLSDVVFPITESSSVLDRSTGKRLYPIYILLTHTGTRLSKLIHTATGDEFTHCSISLDDSLTNMYSFGINRDSGDEGFICENINDPFFQKNDIKYGLYCMFLTKEEFNNIEMKLNYFIDNKTKFHYSFGGLFKNFFKIPDDSKGTRMFCSQFVATILDAGNPNVKIIPHTNLVRPNDFRYWDSVHYICGGDTLKDYNPNITKRKVKELMRSVNSSTPKIQNANIIPELHLPNINNESVDIYTKRDFYLKPTNLKDIFPEKILYEAANNDNKLYPVYLMLIHKGDTFSKIIRLFTGDEFTHISISFNASMKEMYTFGRNTDPKHFYEGGFVVENINGEYHKSRNMPYIVYMILATKAEIELMKTKLRYFSSNKTSFKYNFPAIVQNYFNIENDDEYAYYCSRFVAEILNAGRPNDPYIDNPKLIRPDDFRENEHTYFIAKGYTPKYNKQEVIRNTKKIIEMYNKEHTLKESIYTDGSDSIYQSNLINGNDAAKEFLWDDTSDIVDDDMKNYEYPDGVDGINHEDVLQFNEYEGTDDIQGEGGAICTLRGSLMF